MPRRAAKIISAVLKASTPRKIKARGRALAQGTLLAVTLAASQMDTENVSEKKRLFDPALLDRLRPPLTRYHE